jgi:hypothetical protein
MKEKTRLKTFFKKLFLIFFCFIIKTVAFSQNTRQNDFNNINWVQFFGTKKLGKKTSLLFEYQWRRTDVLKNWQQGLFRTALQFKLNDVATIAFGYAQAETHAYGDFPIAANGTFPEHRLFQQAVVRNTIGKKVTLTNRLRIEQRWLGAVKAGTDREIERWNYLHRFRFLARLQYPISKKMYAWLGDEIFIGAGKNVGQNIFDQNRLHFNIGYSANKNINLELGYINQTLMQGRLINNKTIVQRNNGFLIACNYSF